MVKYEAWIRKEVDNIKLEDMINYSKTCRICKKTSSQFKVGMKIRPLNRMDHGEYEYELSAPVAQTAQDLHTQYKLKSGKIRDFKPHLHPRDMLELGVFEGKMINDCMNEFPIDWYLPALERGTLSPSAPNIEVNFYKLKTRESLQEWIRTDKIKDYDNRGWFQWYCRYALGRRDEKLDTVQMKRWRQMKRWVGKFKAGRGTTKMRQLLLQWSWPHDIGTSTTPL